MLVSTCISAMAVAKAICWVFLCWTGNSADFCNWYFKFLRVRQINCIFLFNLFWITSRLCVIFPCIHNLPRKIKRYMLIISTNRTHRFSTKIWWLLKISSPLTVLLNVLCVYIALFKLAGWCFNKSCKQLKVIQVWSIIRNYQKLYWNYLLLNYFFVRSFNVYIRYFITLSRNES